jgi:hypothetical protein
MILGIGEIGGRKLSAFRNPPSIAKDRRTGLWTCGQLCSRTIDSDHKPFPGPAESGRKRGYGGEAAETSGYPTAGRGVDLSFWGFAIEFFLEWAQFPCNKCDHVFGNQWFTGMVGTVYLN